MNAKVSIIIRYKDPAGTVRNVRPVYAGLARLKPGGGIVDGKEQPVGSNYYLRWYEGGKQAWRKVDGGHNSALLAQIRQENILAGIEQPEEQPKLPAGPTLAECIVSFCKERSTSQDAKAVNDWERELNLFASVCNKRYLADLTSLDVTAYWQRLKDDGYSDRTQYNRVGALKTFLKHFKMGDLVKKLPTYGKKKVDRYTDEALAVFFAACDAEELIR